VRGQSLTTGNTKSCGCLARGGDRKSIGYKNQTFPDTIVSNDVKKSKYHIGSATNTDGTRHILVTGYSSRFGCKTEHLIELQDKDNPSHVIGTYVDDKCHACDSLIRYNAHNEKQCENPYCGLLF
jgi:hypothetical protein